MSGRPACSVCSSPHQCGATCSVTPAASRLAVRLRVLRGKVCPCPSRSPFSGSWMPGPSPAGATGRQVLGPSSFGEERQHNFAFVEYGDRSADVYLDGDEMMANHTAGRRSLELAGRIAIRGFPASGPMCEHHGRVSGRDGQGARTEWCGSYRCGQSGAATPCFQRRSTFWGTRRLWAISARVEAATSTSGRTLRSDIATLPGPGATHEGNG
jgi:hypothetical protein